MLKFLLVTFFSVYMLSHVAQGANTPIDTDLNNGAITSIKIVQSTESAVAQRSTSYEFQFNKLTVKDTQALIGLLNKFINDLSIDPTTTSNVAEPDAVGASTAVGNVKPDTVSAPTAGGNVTRRRGCSGYNHHPDCQCGFGMGW